MYKIKFAFSLIEMLMALLVASLLLAALAPVMTRRTTDNVNVNGLGGTYKAPADMQCYSYSDTNPSVDISINDVYSVSFLIASAGGGGAGATSLKSKTITSTLTGTTGSSSSGTYKEKEIPITDNMDDVIIKTLVGGGGGGGKGYSTKTSLTPSDSACANYGTGKTDTVGNTGTNFAVYDQVGLCVTKFNQISSTNCWTSYTHSKCNSNQNYMRYSYSGCQRAACTHSGAVAACSELANKTGNSWRLPSDTELNKWNTNTTWYALALCDQTNNGNTAYCATASKPSGASYAAWPDRVWGIKSNGGIYRRYLNKTWGTSGNYNANYPFSTRCVLSSYISSKSLSGGSGGSGAYMKNIDITEYVKQAQSTGGGKILLKAGNGGSSAVSGSTSYVYVYDNNNTLLYAVAASGGSNGKSASSSSYGTYGSGGSCSKYNTQTGNWASTSCTGSNGKSGTSGSSNTYSSFGLAVSAPSGASSAYSNSGGGSGGTTSHTAGYAASSYGAGGGAGTGMYTSDTSYSDGLGGNGSGGFAEISYNETYISAPGGGGGGGTVAQIKDVQLGKQTNCTLSIGKGGKGGSIDNNGIDGGASSIKCSTDVRTFTVPGGKGGKIGTSAINNASNPTPGLGGGFSDINKASTTAIKDYNSSKKTIKEGENGKDGIYNQTLKQSIGGRGGKSGTGTFGGCGGLYIENDAKEGICTISDTDVYRINGKGFEYKDTITPSTNELASLSYGIAGSGGGGGGWIRELGPGKGGDGMNGYVCVYWYNE